MNADHIMTYMEWLLFPDRSPPDGEMRDKPSCASWLLAELFFGQPRQTSNKGREREFSDLWSRVRSGATVIPYDLDFPKWEFLAHLIDQGDVLLHGSNRAKVDELAPGPQTRWDQVPIEAVFATSDPIWPIFFATMNWDVLDGSVRNGGFLVDHGDRLERFHFFSADTQARRSDLLIGGHIHVVDRKGFTTSPHPVRFDEWHRESPVPVIATLEVSPADFPFRDQIARHATDEPIQETWTAYKARLND